MHQHLEEPAGLVRRIVDRRQAFAQTAQQLGHQACQGARLFTRQLRLRAPHQAFDQLGVAAWVVGTGFVAHARMCDHLGPRATHEIQHRVGYQRRVRPGPHLRHHGGRQRLALLGFLQGLDGLGELPFVLARRVVPEFHQPRQDLVKGLGGLDHARGQRRNRFAQRLHETAEAARIDRLERNAAVRDLVQQAARRMLLVAEETRVHQSQPQQGRLEFGHQLLHRCKQALVMGDVVDHHGHDFHSQRLIEPVDRAAQLLAHRLRRVGRRRRGGLAALDALYHLVELLELLRGFEGRGDGGTESGRDLLAVHRACLVRIVGFGMLVTLRKLVGGNPWRIGQQAPQLLDCQDRLQRPPGLNCRRHGRSGLPHTTLAQVRAQMLVIGLQLLTQRTRHDGDPGLACCSRHRQVDQRRGHGFHIHRGPQGVVFEAHRGQAEHGADQPVKFGQSNLSRQLHGMVHACTRHALRQLRIVHGRQLVKMQAV